MKRTWLRPVASVCALIAVLPALAAESAGVIDADRPDVVDSPTTVGPGRFQVETGYKRERDRDAGTKATFAMTPTLLRLGVTQKLELQLETDGYARSKLRGAGNETTETGWSDVAPGLKWRVLDGERLMPSAAVLLNAEIDSGSQEFRGEGIRPQLRVALEWDLPGEISLGVMPGIVYDKTEGRRHATGIVAAALSRTWADRFKAFIEVAAERIASSRNGGSNVTYGVGAAYLPATNMQVDTAFSWGANSNAPDFAWTVGFAVRF
jgi:hypothetical protein